MGTPLVWSLTVVVVVVAAFALLCACNCGIAGQQPFKDCKLKITWLKAMFDVHMCFFGILCIDPSVRWPSAYTQGTLPVSLGVIMLIKSSFHWASCLMLQVSAPCWIFSFVSVLPHCIISACLNQFIVCIFFFFFDGRHGAESERLLGHGL